MSKKIQTCFSITGLILFFLPLILGPGVIASPILGALISILGLFFTVIGGGKQ